MKISSMLLVVITLLAAGSAFWLYTQRGEALESANQARAELAKLEAELKEVKQQLVASQKARKAAEGLAEKNSAMINVLKGNAENHTSAMSKSKAEIGELTKSITALKAAKAAADKSAGDLRSNAADLQGKVAALTSELTSSKSALKAAEAAKSQLENLLQQEREARKAAEEKAAAQ